MRMLREDERVGQRGHVVLDAVGGHRVRGLPPRLRDQRLGAELHSGKAEVIRQRFIPGLVDGLLHRGADGALGAAAGALFPQPMLRIDNALRSAQSAASSSARMDDLLCGDGINRFVLLLQDAALLQSLQPGRLPAALLALLQRLDVQVLLLSPVMPEQVPPGVRCVSETATMLADWLKGHAARAVLVRPDRYAYGVASDAAQLRALLASLDVQLR
jgi:3-(3-hydroxy-phenyl)propionate hydroxylase